MLEHRWVKAGAWAHTHSSRPQVSGSSVAQDTEVTVSDVRVTLNHCVRAILVKSHTIPHQPAEAIQLPDCPPRPGSNQEPSDDSTDTNLECFDLTSQPFT